MTRTRLLSLLALSLLTTACADTLPVSPGIPQPHAVATITGNTIPGDAAPSTR